MDLQWMNPPPDWREDGDTVTVTTAEATDFWQVTHYGFRHDNGHFHHATVDGDFTAEVTFGADYQALYDQAGLMLRLGEDCWIKAGVEFVHGVGTLGTVLTRGQSDWAIGPAVDAAATLRLRLTRQGAAVCVQWAPDDGATPFRALRLGWLSDASPALVGPFTCSPSRAGLVTRFRGFTIGPALDFHDVV